MEQIPYHVKKPYPALLITLVHHALENKRADVLEAILDCYDEDQLSFLKKDNTLQKKITHCIQKAEKNTSQATTPARLDIPTQQVEVKKTPNTAPTLKTVAFFDLHKVYSQTIKAVIYDKNPEALQVLFASHPTYNFNIKDQNQRSLLDVVYTRIRQFETKSEEKDSTNKLTSYRDYLLSKEIFKLLLQKLNINGRTKGGKTLLSIAMENKAPLTDIVVFLLMGADYNLEDANGKKAIQYLSENVGVVQIKDASRERLLVLEKHAKVYIDSCSKILTEGLAALLDDKNKDLLNQVAKNINHELLDTLFPNYPSDSIKQEVLLKLRQSQFAPTYSKTIRVNA